MTNQNYAVPGEIQVFSSSLHIPEQFLEKEMLGFKYSTVENSAIDEIREMSDATDPTQSIRNFTSAIKSWRTFCNREDRSSNVGAELHTKFVETLEGFVTMLKNAGLSEAVARDRKSAVKRLKKHLDILKSIKAGTRDKRLSVELKKLMIQCGISGKELEKKACVSISFIRRALAGAEQQRNIGKINLTRIEAALIKEGATIQKGHLVDLMPFSLAKDRLVVSSAKFSGKELCISPLIAHRAKASSQPRNKLVPLSEVREKFPNLYEFLKRSFNRNYAQDANWTRHELKTGTYPLWPFREGGRVYYCPTFDKYLNNIKMFFGYLLNSGVVRVEDLDDPSIFMSSELICSWIRNQVEGNSGEVTSAVRTSKVVFYKFGEEVRKEAAEGTLSLGFGLDASKFSEYKDVVDKLYSKAPKTKKVDPKVGTQIFCDLEEPFAPFLKIREALMVRSKGAAHLVPQALSQRNSVLLSIMMSFPLRVRSLGALTYKEDNSGSLYFDEKEGCWAINLAPMFVKNRKRLKRHLPKALNSQLSEYFSEGWLRLRSTYERRGIPAPDYVLLAQYAGESTGQKVVTEGGETVRIPQGAAQASLVLANITKNYLGVSIRAHMFRHIAATRFLKKNPSNYQALADLLGDKLETVMSEYAHHDQRWSTKVINETLEELFV